MKFIGIDPGISGGIAILSEDGLELHTMPVIDKVLDAHQLSSILFKHRDAKMCVIEKVGAMPGQGVVSMFSFGKTCGLIEGVVAALGISYSLCTPQKWQKAVLSGVMLNTTPKNRALIGAKRLFPNNDFLATPRSRVPHDGLVDAALIARYASVTG